MINVDTASKSNVKSIIPSELDNEFSSLSWSRKYELVGGDRSRTVSKIPCSGASVTSFGFSFERLEFNSPPSTSVEISEG